MSIAGQIRRAFTLAFLLPLLGGCFVTSEHPVLRAGEDGRDPELRGLWVTEEGHEFLHVLRPEREDGEEEAEEAPDFSGLYVVSRQDDAKDRDNWARVRMISTKVKDHRILSMRFREGEGGGDLDDMPGWLIFAYGIHDGRLYLRMIEEDAIDAAIRAGELKGTPKSGSASDPHATASPEEWIAFLEQAELGPLFADDDDTFLVRLPAADIRRVTGKEDTGSEGAP